MRSNKSYMATNLEIRKILRHSALWIQLDYKSYFVRFIVRRTIGIHNICRDGSVSSMDQRFLHDCKHIHISQNECSENFQKYLVRQWTYIKFSWNIKYKQVNWFSIIVVHTLSKRKLKTNRKLYGSLDDPKLNWKDAHKWKNTYMYILKFDQALNRLKCCLAQNPLELISKTNNIMEGKQKLLQTTF